jgi:hypothetical protein
MLAGQRDAFRRMLKGECVGREADIKTLTDQLKAERARVTALERSVAMSVSMASPAINITAHLDRSPSKAHKIESSQIAGERPDGSSSVDKETSPVCEVTHSLVAARNVSVSPTVHSIHSRTMTSIEASPPVHGNLTKGGGGSAASVPVPISEADPKSAAPAERNQDPACNDVALLNKLLAEARARLAVLEKHAARNEVSLMLCTLVCFP